MRRALSIALAMIAVANLVASAYGEMVVEWWGAKYCRHKDRKIALSRYGKEGMINPKMGKRPIEGIHALRFDLSKLKRRTKIYHASLRLHTPLERIRTDKRAYMSIGSGVFYYDPLRLYAETRPWKPIEIYVVEGFSENSKPVYDKKKPLKLEPPQFKSFDVTEAVRDWASRKRPNHGFLVRQLDLWDWWPARTVLEVRYDGKLKHPPPQVTGLKVSHRKGQTFITWTEPDKIITKEKIYWKEFETTFKKAAPRQGRFYRIYRSEKPITARNLAAAERIDEIWPLSGYDGRMHEHMTRGENWIGLNPKAYVPRYVVDDPPDGPLQPNGTYGKGMPQWWGKQLPLHTGLYVHQPRNAGKAYYAVTALVNGVENTREIAPANSLAKPVEEKPAPGEPILYRCLDQSAGRGRRRRIRETQFFVYWAAPPYANQPRRPIHIMVGLNGPRPPQDVAVKYNIADMYGSDLIRGTHPHSWKGDARIFAVVDDAAFGNKGYWSSWNALFSREQAKHEPYTQRIVTLLRPWVKKLKKRACDIPEPPARAKIAK